MTNSFSTISSLAEILSRLKDSTYSLAIPDSFAQQYFADRDCVSRLTEAYLSRERRYRNYLKTAPASARVRLGAHRFGLSTIEEHYALAQIIAGLSAQNLLEIGTFRGHTALTIMRACQQQGSATQFTSFDIDQSAIDIAKTVLSENELSGNWNLVVGKSMDHLSAMKAIDFAFIDGDHSYKAAAEEFVACYNSLNVPGIVALHDVGSPAWGFHQDPGKLFFKVLPPLLEGKADLFWLDSMCRQFTMQALANENDNYRFCQSPQETIELAKLTMLDTIDGAGGLGFVLKLDASHTVDPAEVLQLQPATCVPAPTAQSRPQSLIGRVARKIAAMIP